MAALSRLFGKSKKDPPSPSGSHHSPDLSEREGDDNFTVVERGNTVAPANDPPPSYPSLSELPYQLPGRGSTAQGAGRGGQGGVAIKIHQSNSYTHPLEGVVFSLSPKLTTDKELDQMSLTVDNVMRKIRSLEWATFDYNFSLEQSVIDTEINIHSVNINNN